MENTNNIMLMLNKIENSLNELSRRVSALEGRQNIAQPMRVNPVPNTSPYNIRPLPMLKPNEMYVLHGRNPRSPQGNPQYNPQYSPQYVVSKSIDELNSIRGRLLNHFTNCVKQNLSANDDDVFDKLHAIERILIEGLINLQHNYNIRHNDDSDLIRISKAVSNIYTKHCFNTTPGITSNLDDLKHDIKELVRYWNINTVNNSTVNNSYTAKPVGKENLLDMEEWVNKTGYRYQQPITNSGRPLDTIIDTIVEALTNRHKINLTVFEKNALDKLKSLDSIPLDIYNNVSSLHLHVTQYNCMSAIFKPLLTAIVDMMYDRGYMKDIASKEEIVNVKPMNRAENIKCVNQDSGIKKPTNDNVNINKFDIMETIKNVVNRLLDLPFYAPDYQLNKHELNKCVDLLNAYLMLNYTQLDTAKEITSKHTTCKYLVNELLKLLDSYNVPNTYKFGMYINNLDKLTVDLDKLIKDYNNISILNLGKAPIVNKSKKQHVRKR